MAKRPTKDSVDWRELKRKFDAISERAVESFVTPKYPTRQVVKLGTPRTTLQNWLTSKTFTLDADKHRAANSARAFSPRDIVLLTCAATLVGIGVPLAIAKEVAVQVTQTVQGSLCTVQMSAASGQLAIFRANDRWVVAAPRPAPPNSAKRSAHWTIFADDGTTTVADEDGGIPPIHISFDVDGFSSRLLDQLGFVVMGRGVGKS